MHEEFTKDELYLIERTFDELYSVIDARILKAGEEFLNIRVLLKDETEIKLFTLETLKRMIVSADKHREISEKCERIRLGINKS